MTNNRSKKQIFSLSEKKSFLRSPLWQGLTTAEIRVVLQAQSFTYQEYAKGDILLNQGAFVEQIGILLSGTVAEVKLHYEKSSQLLALRQASDILGLPAVSSRFSTSPCLLTAETDCLATFFPYATLFSHSRISHETKGKLRQNIINLLCDEHIQMLYKIDALSEKYLRERVLTFLSILVEKKGSPTVNVGMTHKQLAHYLCANRSALTRELRRMKQDGLITYRRQVYTLLSSPSSASTHTSTSSSEDMSLQLPTQE